MKAIRYNLIEGLENRQFLSAVIETISAPLPITLPAKSITVDQDIGMQQIAGTWIGQATIEKSAVNFRLDIKGVSLDGTFDARFSYSAVGDKTFEVVAVGQYEPAKNFFTMSWRDGKTTIGTLSGVYNDRSGTLACTVDFVHDGVRANYSVSLARAQVFEPKVFGSATTVDPKTDSVRAAPTNADTRLLVGSWVGSIYDRGLVATVRLDVLGVKPDGTMFARVTFQPLKGEKLVVNAFGQHQAEKGFSLSWYEKGASFGTVTGTFGPKVGTMEFGIDFTTHTGDRSAYSTTLEKTSDKTTEPKVLVENPKLAGLENHKVL